MRACCQERRGSAFVVPFMACLVVAGAAAALSGRGPWREAESSARVVRPQPPGRAPRAAPPHEAGRGGPSHDPTAATARAHAAPRVPPASLRGADVDGALRVDARGDLVLGPEVVALFEHFLSATGEEPLATIRQRIVALIEARLDGRAAEQATTLLDRYLGYREAARGLSAERDDPAARLEAVRELRRDALGAETAERLFGDEEREAAVAIEARRIASDAELSSEEREAKLAALEAELPEGARAARAAATRPLRQRAEEQALREAGANEEALYAYRTATVGTEAAERLAALDQRRAAWERRVDAFREERERLAARTRDEASRRAEEEVLLTRSFTPEERLRVRAILSIEGE